MINVLLLAAGNEELVTPEHPYPIMLQEFSGVPVIEKVLIKSKQIHDSSRIVVIRKQPEKHNRLPEIIKLIDPEARIIEVKHGTGGAACSALWAISHINSDDELLILNANEVLEIDFSEAIEELKSSNADVGILSFPSVHPRYSYARINEDNSVSEVAEKRPISRTATAGFYWFKRGSDFVSAAMKMIQNQAHVDGNYYVCPSINELILQNAKVTAIPIAAESYIPLKENNQRK